MLFFLSISYVFSTQRTGGGTGHTTRLQTRREVRREWRRRWVQRQVAEQNMRYLRGRRGVSFVLIGLVMLLGNYIFSMATKPISIIMAILSLLMVGASLDYIRYRVDNLIYNNQREWAELLTETTQIDPSSEEEE